MKKNALIFAAGAASAVVAFALLMVLEGQNTYSSSSEYN
jgi:hypothetical protein